MENKTKTFVEKVQEVSQSVNDLNQSIHNLYKKLEAIDGKLNLLEDSVDCILHICDKKNLFSQEDMEKELTALSTNKRKAELAIAEQVGSIVKADSITGTDDEIVSYTLEPDSLYNYFLFKEFNEDTKKQLIGKKSGDKIVTKNKDKDVYLNILEIYKFNKGMSNEKGKE